MWVFFSFFKFIYYTIMWIEKTFYYGMKIANYEIAKAIFKESIVKNKGFSLIEVMVVIVIIGILAAVAVVNFIRLRDRAKEAEVKVNAHILHLSAEEYSTSSDGFYIDEANMDSLSMLKSLKNPFNSSGAAWSPNAPAEAGCVSYDHDDFSPSTYTIIGAGKNGSTDTIIIISPGYSE